MVENLVREQVAGPGGGRSPGVSPRGVLRAGLPGGRSIDMERGPVKILLRLPILLLILGGLEAEGGPDSVWIEKLDGIVVELPEEQRAGFDAVTIRVTRASDPDAVKGLYRVLRTEPEYVNHDLRRPKRGEAMLVFPKGKLPLAIKVGDRIVVHRFGFGGRQSGSGFFPKNPPKPSPTVDKIELNPKG